MNQDLWEQVLGPGHPWIPVLVWFGAVAVAFTGVFAFFKWGWPKLTSAVTLVNLLLTLNERLDKLTAAMKSLDGLEEKLERVRAQVENDHDTNMREENDERHHEIIASVQRVQDEITGVKKDVGRLDRRDIERGVDIRDLTKKLDRALEQGDANEDRIENLEDTIDPTKEKP